MPAPYGERIRELRKRRGMTLEALAAATDSSKSYIWELENKDPPRPSADKIGKIAEALGVTGDYLMGHEDSDLPTAEEKAFFRKYQRMSPETQAKLRKMAALLDDGD